MRRLLTFLTLAVLATPAAYGQKGNNNGARVGKAGFLLNVSALKSVRAETSPVPIDARSRFRPTTRASRRTTRPRSTRSSCGRAPTSRCKTVMRATKPALTSSCRSPRPTARIAAARRCPRRRSREYEVRARVLGKPRGRSTITSCVEMLEIDALTQAEIATSLCSVGAQNIWVGTRSTGGGRAPEWVGERERATADGVRG